jgi:acyl-CoA reductase-like NAD-dependent aldehyde dehydrogenase
MAQAAVTGIPFGGVGTFGNGKFRGKYGFEIFTNLNEIRTVSTSDEYEVMTEFR